MRHGFSLVELSIVLVILGLLTGGILAGQSLIRAAELRAIPTEYNRYITAMHSFRDKYFQLPGDFSKAEDFWTPQAVADADCRSTESPGQATCNGNGDGILRADAPRSQETFRFWQHLANAGLIEGTYRGISGPSHATDDVQMGWNTPRSKLSGATFHINVDVDATIPPADPHYFAGSITRNMFIFGGKYGSTSSYGPIMLPEEAWNIDVKTDDGKPAIGNTRAMKSTSTINPGCTDGSAADANYALTSRSKLCSLVLLMPI